MILVFKKHSLRRFKLLTAVFLLASIFFLMTGCTSVEKAELSDPSMKNLEMLTGKVQGEGISVKLTDNPEVKEQIYGTVLDFHIIQIVNLLEKSGAEAICINDERVISTSEIKAHGMMIRVNSKKFNAPFVINAIGNFEALNTELVNELNFDENEEHIKIKIEKKDKLLIPEYNESINFQYAKPVK